MAFAGIGTADKWENFPGAFSARRRKQRLTAAAAPSHGSPKGNAPFRFRAVALFSRGGSEIAAPYFGNLNRAPRSDYVLEFILIVVAWSLLSSEIHLPRKLSLPLSSTSSSEKQKGNSVITVVIVLDHAIQVKNSDFFRQISLL